MKNIGRLKLWASLRKHHLEKYVKALEKGNPVFLDLVPSLQGELKGYYAIIKHIERMEKDIDAKKRTRGMHQEVGEGSPENVED